jgi:hypothetical protein
MKCISKFYAQVLVKNNYWLILLNISFLALSLIFYTINLGIHTINIEYLSSKCRGTAEDGEYNKRCGFTEKLHNFILVFSLLQFISLRCPIRNGDM